VMLDTTLAAGAATPASPTIDDGSSVMLDAAPSGGTPGYTYQWYEGLSATCSSDPAIVGATGATYLATPASSAYYCYSLHDASTGWPAAVSLSATDFVRVDSALVAGAVTAPTLSVTHGHSVNLTANPSGGTPGYTYQWYAGTSSTCSSDTAITGATTQTIEVSPNASTYYCYVVEDDSTGHAAPGTASPTVEVTYGSPSSSAPFPWLYVIGGVVVVAVVGGVAWLLLRQKQGPRAKPEQPGNPAQAGGTAPP